VNHAIRSSGAGVKAAHGSAPASIAANSAATAETVLAENFFLTVSLYRQPGRVVQQSKSIDTFHAPHRRPCVLNLAKFA